MSHFDFKMTFFIFQSFPSFQFLHCALLYFSQLLFVWNVSHSWRLCKIVILYCNKVKLLYQHKISHSCKIWLYFKSHLTDRDWDDLRWGTLRSGEVRQEGRKERELNNISSHYFPSLLKIHWWWSDRLNEICRGPFLALDLILTVPK